MPVFPFCLYVSIGLMAPLGCSTGKKTIVCRLKLVFSDNYNIQNNLNEFETRKRIILLSKTGSNRF